MTQISVSLTSEFRLEQALKEAGVKAPAAITRLIVSGEIMYADCKYVRENMAKTLQELDLSDVYSENKLCMCVFPDCSGLTSVVLPNSITPIRTSFCRCTALTSVSIPDSVECIGESAFSECTALTSITIPGSVTYIGRGAFAGCSNLTTINIIDSTKYKYIDRFAFAYCDALTSIVIPNSVMAIFAGVFAGCAALTSVTIPDSVVEIHDHAFAGCSSLTSLIIPRSVTSIGKHTFNIGASFRCEAFISGLFRIMDNRTLRSCKANITVHPDNPVYTDRKSVV